MTPDTFRAIQADTFSSHARALLPLLLQHAHPRSEADKAALGVLARWNLDARADSAAAALFEAWFLRLSPLLVQDALGPAVSRAYERRFTFITRFVTNMLTREPSAFCQSVGSTSANPGTAGSACDAVVTAALHEGVAMLTERLGPNMARWQWGAVHRAVFPHQGFDTVTGLRWLLSRSVASQGDWRSINVGASDVNRPFEQSEIPGYRQIVDLSAVNDSRYLGSVGQAGHFLSPHYDDQLRRWREVRHLPMRTDRVDIDEGAVGHLRLVPVP